MTTLTASAFDQFARAQPAAAAALRDAVAADAVAHAWLLFGPPGVGQVEAARYLGAALNCEDEQARSTGRPCGICGSCHRVLAGTHTAVLDFEPEGAMHRVKDVRDEWIPTATRTSLGGRAKVLRIVAADRMNEAAQNAFLKVLEEPPASVVWVLDVADDSALLDTIISRCRRLDVTPWSQQLLRERLDAWVAAGEGDPGVGSGAEVLPRLPEGKKISKTLQAQHDEELARHRPDAPSPAERTAMTRLAKGSPELLRTLATCDGQALRDVACTCVDTILDLGPRAAGGAAPMLANRVLDLLAHAQDRIETEARRELYELGLALGLTIDWEDTSNWPKVARQTPFPSGVEKRHKERTKRQQRDAATSTCALFLDLLGAFLTDVLVAWQAAPAAPPDEAIRNVDRQAALGRAANNLQPAGILDVLDAIEQAHVALDLNGDRKLHLERVLVRLVLASAAS